MADALSLHTRVRQTRNMPTGVIDEEMVALDAAKGDVLGLDPIGTRLWQMAASAVTLGEMVDHATHAFEVDEDQATHDILAFAQDMIAAGLFERVA